MAQIALGDRRAFQTLFLRHGGHLLGYAHRFVLSRDRAEDMTQEAWMKVIRLASSYKGTGHFVAWIYTLTRNLCLNELRSENRLVVQETPTPEDEIRGREQLPSAQSLEDELLQKESLQELKSCLDSLPETQRVALLLYAVEGLSYDDIAREMNSSLSAVKSLIFRARSEIQKQLPTLTVAAVASKGRQ